MGFCSGSEAVEAVQWLGCIAVNEISWPLFSNQDVRSSRFVSTAARLISLGQKPLGQGHQ